MGFFFGAIENSDAAIELLLRISSFNFRAFLFVFCCLVCLKLFKGSAANRHIYIFLALLATLLLPLASSIAPSVDIVFEIPSPITKSVEAFTNETKISNSGLNSNSNLVQAVHEQEKTSVLMLARNNIHFIIQTLLIVYFLIALSILLKVLISNLRICITTMHATVSYQNNWRNIIDFHRTRFWMSTPVELRHSQHIRSPMTWGIIKPVILIPSAALEWDDDLIKSTVLHELAHIKRGDWLTQQLAWCVSAIYWVNPLIWRSLNYLHTYAETAADDMALRAGVKKSHYAENLLCVAEKICQRRRVNYAALSMATKGSELSTRISAILNPEGIHTPVSSKPLFLALAIIFLFLLPMTSIQANYRQKIQLPNNVNGSQNSRNDQNLTAPLFSDRETTIKNNFANSAPTNLLFNGHQTRMDKNDIGIIAPSTVVNFKDVEFVTNPDTTAATTTGTNTTTNTETTNISNTTSKSITSRSPVKKLQEAIEPITQASKSELLIDISQVDALKIAGSRLMQSIQAKPKTKTITAYESQSEKELANEFSQTTLPIQEKNSHPWHSFGQHASSNTNEPGTETELNKVITTLKPMNVVKPRYPNIAIRRGIEGEVRVQFSVDKQGRVNETTILAASPRGIFDRNVLRALKKSEFQPKTINGQAVSVEGIQEVYRFVLES